VASASAPTPQVNGEYNAEELWRVCSRLTRQVIANLDSAQHIASVAVASMGESGVLLDTEHQPLAPIIPWHDKRTADLIDTIRAQISEPDLYRITGLPLRHIYSASKLMWYRDYAPEIFARAQTWLCLADWITFRLTGQCTTSYSMACRTMLFDVRQRAWSDELLRVMNLPGHLLPPVSPSGQIIGTVTRSAANETGLPEGTPVATGGHDHICAALAAGVIEPGSVLDSSGTVEVLLIPLAAPVLDYVLTSGMACGCHTARDEYYLLGGVMSGGIVDWLARLFAGDDLPETVTRLMQEASTSPLGANGLWFEPYLGGAASRPRDPNAWGAWLGLRLHHTRADLLRAAMEGLTFGIRYLAQGIEEASGHAIQQMRAVGGGTRNVWWQQLKADVLGVPIETLVVSDVTAQGAALLAGIGIGMFADATDAARRAYHPAARYKPNPENHAEYNILYRAVFETLYPALKNISLKGEGL
jgi:xylulokinase